MKTETNWFRYEEPFEWDDDPELWEIIVSYMNDEIREQVHFELAPCNRKEFIERYLDLDPQMYDLLWSEFGIE